MVEIQEQLEESPPVLGSWKNIYVAVLSYVALLIATLYLLTRLAEY